MSFRVPPLRDEESRLNDHGDAFAGRRFLVVPQVRDSSE
jgi:hypothetical protein